MSQRTSEFSRRPALRRGWLRLDMRAMLALVGCCGLVLWAWRTVTDLDPVRAAFRRVGVGNEAERERTVRTLSELNQEESDEAIPLLIEATRDPSPAVRLAAVRGLTRDFLVLANGPTFGGPAPHDPKVVNAHGVAVIHALLRELRDADGSVRTASRESLAAVLLHERVISLAAPRPREEGPSPLDRAAVLRALESAAGDPDVEIRSWGAENLARFCSTWKTGTPPIVRALLADPSPKVRAAAATWIPRFNDSIDELLPELFRMHAEDTPEVRTAAGTGLYYGAHPSAASIPELIKQLSSPVRAVRGTAASLLERFGPLAADAVPALVGSLKRSLEETSKGAGIEPVFDPLIQTALALKAIDPDGRAIRGEAVPVLLEALRAPAARVREVAIRGLANLGRDAEPAVPAISEILEGEEKGTPVQTYAALALTMIAPGTPSSGRAHQALVRAVKKGGLYWDQAMINRNLRLLESAPAPAQKPSAPGKEAGKTPPRSS